MVSLLRYFCDCDLPSLFFLTTTIIITISNHDDSYTLHSNVSNSNISLVNKLVKFDNPIKKQVPTVRT